MRVKTFASALFACALLLGPVAASASDHGAHADASGPACVGFGPQTPRDIDHHAGKNQRSFSTAPDSTAMNLCNIHFHTHAEHKAKDYSLYAGEGEHGHGGGYQCNATSGLSAEELSPPQSASCKDMKPGDTIEVHWVYSSCDVQPGKGLGSCLSPACANPNLRVEAAVFLVVNDDEALNFTDYTYGGHMVDGLHQPKSLPGNSGRPVVFAGSTTGPSYTEQQCSPMQVTWSVRPICAKIDIDSLSAFCNENVFEEDHAHGVRQLVTNPDLLAPIK